MNMIESLRKFTTEQIQIMREQYTSSKISGDAYLIFTSDLMEILYWYANSNIRPSVFAIEDRLHKIRNEYISIINKGNLSSPRGGENVWYNSDFKHTLNKIVYELEYFIRHN